MGFIKYHGSEESHYEDLLEYTRIQDEIERQKRDELEKQKWFSEFSGNPKYAAMDANSILKFAVKSYREAADCYRRIIGVTGSDGSNHLQLWQDLWLECSDSCIRAADLPEEKRQQLLQIITGKLLQLNGKTETGQHVREMSENPRYTRYMARSFSMEERSIPQYWKWLCRWQSPNRQELAVLAEKYAQYCMFLSFYLYKSVHPSTGRWMSFMEQSRSGTSEIRTRLQKNEDFGAAVQPENPLYSKSFLQQMTVYVCILLFQRGENKGQKEDWRMIEDLYDYLNETDAQDEAITSILPEEIRAQIRTGRLPVFESASVSGIQPDEQIHYINHMVLYKTEERNDSSYTPKKGSLIITDKRIAFRSANVSDIPLSQLERVIRYDMKPVIIEFQSGDKSVYISVPDPAEIYEVLRMIANKGARQTSSDIRVPMSYEDLVEKADLDACVFSLECLETYPLPEELKSRILLLVKKLYGLKHATVAHPERKQDISRFLEYYLPEAVRIVASYSDYQLSGLDDKTLQKTYTMISNAIDTLDSAAEQEIMSIYKMESMETRAKADALRQILEQDGYYKSNQILKH
ncbi:MAG: hypothetical protein IJI45_00685 [Anaerolineaceae bacterium]|nr:hypothetical protein [Anaerolineaceae bacterium]